MIQAKSIVIAVDPERKDVRPDVSKHVANIDVMLAKPWHKYELEDDDGPDHSGSNYAGRSYDVKPLSRAEVLEIERLYRDAGWTIVSHGNRTDNAYTRPENAGRYLRFIPPCAKSASVRGRG